MIGLSAAPRSPASRPLERARFPALAALAVLAIASATRAAGPPVVISELQAANRSGTLDEDWDASDWIEIHNPGDAPADLSGLKLSDDPANPVKWTFPNRALAPGAYLIVWASGKNRHAAPPATLARVGSQVPFETTFIRAGERWPYLIAEPGTTGPPAGWTEVDFDDAPWARGRSGFGYADGDDRTLLPEGTTAVFIRRQFTVEDPRALGQPVLRIDYDDGFVAYLNGVRVAAANSPAGEPDFNATATRKHEPGRPEAFDLSAHAAVFRAGVNVLAVAGLNAPPPTTDMSLIPELGTFPFILHASFELAAAGGEVLLSGPAGEVLDRVRYPQQGEDRSYGRVPGEDDRWAHFLTPTPGSANVHRPFAEPPAAQLTWSPPAGFHETPVEALFRLEGVASGLEIRGAIGGPPPAADSPSLPGPIPVAQPAILRAAAYLGAERATPVVTASHFFGAPPPLPAIALALEPGDYQAIHAHENGHGREWERPAHCELFDERGKLLVSTPVGFRLHGGYGRKGGLETKKSYRLYFRRFYGDRALDGALLPGLPAGNLDKLVLRANFNDRLGSYHHGAAFIRDQVIRDLHQDMGAPVSRGSWCVLYVNGDFKGLYNPVERLDEEFLERCLGGSDWDLVKTGNEVVAGSIDEWEALHEYARKNSLALKEHYDSVAARIDLENFTGYMILNLWSQNEDWPQNNWFAARRRVAGAKWIFLSWDAEWGLGHTPAGYGADSIRNCLSKTGHLRDLFAALLRNDEYRRYFRDQATRHVAGALRAENVERHLDRHAARIRPVVGAELEANAPGFAPELWEGNLRTLRSFARKRGPFFLSVIERSLASSPPDVFGPAH